MPAKPLGHLQVPSYSLHSAYCPQLKTGRRQLKLVEESKAWLIDLRIEAEREEKEGERNKPWRAIGGAIIHQSQLGPHHVDGSVVVEGGRDAC